MVRRVSFTLLAVAAIVVASWATSVLLFGLSKRLLRSHIQERLTRPSGVAHASAFAMPMRAHGLSSAAGRRLRGPSGAQR